MIILVFYCLVITCPLYAESKFSTSINATYEFGIDKAKNQGFGLEVVERYNFTKIFSAGIGVGIYYSNLLFDDGGNEFGDSGIFSSKYREDGAYIPLFLNLKVNFIKQGISPYLSLSGGYSFLIPFSEYAKSAKLGFMIRPSFGVKFPISKGSLFAEIGYKYQRMSFDGYGLDYQLNHSNLFLSFGYNF